MDSKLKLRTNNMRVTTLVETTSRVEDVVEYLVESNYLPSTYIDEGTSFRLGGSVASWEDEISVLGIAGSNDSTSIPEVDIVLQK